MWTYVIMAYWPHLKQWIETTSGPPGYASRDAARAAAADMLRAYCKTPMEPHKPRLQFCGVVRPIC